MVIYKFITAKTILPPKRIWSGGMTKNVLGALFSHGCTEQASKRNSSLYRKCSLLTMGMGMQPDYVCNNPILNA
jgi:hypothetical protein